MKKIIFTLFLSLLLNSSAHAVDFKIFDMRNKIFEESKEIKILLPSSNDTIVLTSMFDSCLIAMSQLDAYFNMLGIFESIKQEDLSNTPIDFIINWLDEIKRSSDLNLKSMTNITQPLETKTKEHIEKLKYYFKELNKIADDELNKLNLLKKAVRVKARR
jgi:hypothetical protein